MERAEGGTTDEDLVEGGAPPAVRSSELFMLQLDDRKLS